MKQDRRKFIKLTMRGIVVVGLAGLSGMLIFRDEPENPDKCKFDFICRNCKSQNTCSLPEADEYRKTADIKEE